MMSLLGTTALQGTAAQAAVINQDLVFSASGQSIFQTGTGGALNYSGLLGPSFNSSNSIGGVSCVRFFGCAGAEATLKASGSAGLGYSVQIGAGSLTLTFPEKVTFTTPDPGAVASGGAFTIQANVTPGKSITLATGAVASANLQTTGPTLAASLALQAQAKLDANGRVCIAACAQGSLNINPTFNQPLLALDSTTGSLSVLGNQVANVNKGFNASLLNGAVKVNAQLPALNTNSDKAGGGFNGTSLNATVRANVLGVNVSLDKVLTTIAGLPPLQGSINIGAGKLSYNALTATAGAALDVQQNLSFTPNLKAVLGFTGGVSMQQANGTFAPAGTSASLSLVAGLNTFTFKAPGVTSLGVNPVFTLANTTSNQTSLLTSGSIRVEAGSISAFGKSLGPLVDTTLSLGSLPPVSLYSNTFGVNVPTIKATPFNIAFNPNAKATVFGTSVTAAATAGSTNEDYITIVNANGSNSIYQVDQLDAQIANGVFFVADPANPPPGGICATAGGLGSGGSELVCSGDDTTPIQAYLDGLQQQGQGVNFLATTDAAATESNGQLVFYDGAVTAPVDNSAISQNTNAMDAAELAQLGVDGSATPDIAAMTDPVPGDEIPANFPADAQSFTADQAIPAEFQPVGTAVPEPGTLAVMGAALAALGLGRKRRRGGSAAA